MTTKSKKNSKQAQTVATQATQAQTVETVATTTQPKAKTVTDLTIANVQDYAKYFNVFSKICRYKRLSSVEKIKKQKGLFTKCLNITAKSYQKLLQDYKAEIVSNLTEEQKAVKALIRSFSIALDSAFNAAQLEKEFANKIAAIKRINKDFDAVQFCIANYRYVQANAKDISGFLATKTTYKEHKGGLYKCIELCALDDKTATPAQAVAIVRNSVDNYYLSLKNTFKSKETKGNAYNVGTLVSVSVMMEDGWFKKEPAITDISEYTDVEREDAAKRIKAAKASV